MAIQVARSARHWQSCALAVEEADGLVAALPMSGTRAARCASGETAAGGETVVTAVARVQPVAASLTALQALRRLLLRAQAEDEPAALRAALLACKEEQGLRGVAGAQGTAAQVHLPSKLSVLYIDLRLDHRGNTGVHGVNHRGR